jgi:tetraacyldisaccharide 4'-kinase
MSLPRPIAVAIRPLSPIYGWGVGFRKWMYAKGLLKTRRLKATVISVGNLTAGGTGKTPMVLWLAEKFVARGKKVAILSRGYKGSGGTSDEVELLRHRLRDYVKFGIGPDRYESGLRLESENSIDMFLLDDGFQHLQLARDLDIVMIDGSRKLADEWLLPAGLLREPLSACRRADILIVSRTIEPSALGPLDADRSRTFYAQTRLLGFRRFESDQASGYLNELGPGPFLAFCGIGNPDAFFADLGRWGVPVAECEAFGDHHKYSPNDVQRLQLTAKGCKAVGFVTTEKDAANLPPSGFHMPVWVAVIDLVFAAESELTAAIDRILQTRRGAAA